MRYLLITLICCVSLSAMGQELSKAEKKELKKQAKSLKSDLNKLKAMNEELSSLRSEVGRAQQQAAAAQSAADEKESRISDLESQLAEARAAAQAAPKAAPARQQATAIDEAGLSFRVQIGGYKNLDLAQYEDPSGELVKVDENDKGTEQIAIGRFTSYQKANAFKKHLRNMGLKDAFIVPYQDGQRVPLKDVVDQLDLKE